MMPKFLLAQRAPVDGYPPVLHQAAILSGHGAVTVLDTSNGSGAAFQTSEDVNRIRIARRESGGASGTLGRFRTAMQFRTTMAAQLGKQPDVAIAFEPEAAVHLLAGPRRASSTMRIVHLHEHPDPLTAAVSPMARWSLRRALGRLHLADAVVVADQHRSAELVRVAELRAQPLVVMNCPPVLRELPESRLDALLATRAMKGPVVLYHGAVGPDHGLEAAISSMPFWENNANFVVIGSGRADYLQSLERLAISSGVAARFLLAGPVPYNAVLSCVAGATIGLSLLDTRAPNWRWAAGASNKRFEYVALAIPQVTNQGPGMADLFERTGVAVLVDPHDPRSIAAGVNRYLSSPELRKSASLAARSLHLSRYNYEAQFQPVLDLVRDHLARGS